MQKPVMVVCLSPKYFIGQRGRLNIRSAWAVDLRGERQAKKSNCFVRDRIGTYLEQATKSPNPPNTRDTSSQVIQGKPPTCMPPWKPEGPGAGQCHTLTSVSSEFVRDSFF